MEKTIEEVKRIRLSQDKDYQELLKSKRWLEETLEKINKKINNINKK